MARSIDFAIPGGWHVTLFHPLEWVVVGAVVLIGLAAVLKFVAAR